MHFLTEAKDLALDELSVKMQAELKQFEVDTAADPKQLELIGWSDKQTAQPTAPPGQPRTLEIASQSPDGTIGFDWKAPGPGPFGPPRAYVVLRRMATPTGFTSWQDTTISIQPHAALTNQPQRVQLEYRVVAVNTAGTSVPSNSVSVVL